MKKKNLKHDKKQQKKNKQIQSEKVEKSSSNKSSTSFLENLLNKNSLKLCFKHKGRKIGEEYENFPIPEEIKDEFQAKGVRFYSEKMNYNYRPSNRSFNFNSSLLYRNQKICCLFGP
jgi:hypothetical protein